MTRRTMTCRLTVLAVVGALALAACGDDDDSGDAADFCAAAASYDAANTDVPNPSTGTREELEAAFSEMRAALDEMREAAPAELEDDVATLVTTFGDFFDAFESADYDYEALIADPDGLAAADALSSTEMAEATGNLLDYVQQQCDVATTG